MSGRGMSFRGLAPLFGSKSARVLGVEGYPDPSSKAAGVLVDGNRRERKRRMMYSKKDSMFSFSGLEADPDKTKLQRAKELSVALMITLAMCLRATVVFILMNLFHGCRVLLQWALPRRNPDGSPDG